MSVSVTPLPSFIPGDVGFALGANFDGSVIVGNTDDGSGNTIPCVWTNGAIATLPLLAGGNTGSANGCEHTGTVIVGSSNNGAGIDNATYWSSGTITTLSALVAGKPAHALHCSNDASVIVGDAADAGNNPHAAVWTLGVLSTLPGLAGNRGQAFACSSDGNSIVGDVFLLGGNETPALWVAGVLSVLPFLPGTTFGLALGISKDASIAVGWCNSTGVGAPPFQACYWKAGAVFPLTAFGMPGEGTLANGASSTGALIAGSADDGAIVHPVLWSQSNTLTVLPRLPLASDSFAGAAEDFSGSDAIVVGGGDDALSITLGIEWIFANAQLPKYYAQPLSHPWRNDPVAAGVR